MTLPIGWPRRKPAERAEAETNYIQRVADNKRKARTLARLGRERKARPKK